MECLRLRVKDIDFENHSIIVYDGKGEDDRVTILPDSLIPTLRSQIETVRRIHQTDLADGFGEVWLPYALARKYPSASKEFAWQYLFPSPNLSRDPRLPSPLGSPLTEAGRPGEAPRMGVEVKTTMIYTHVLQKGAMTVRSPLDD